MARGMMMAFQRAAIPYIMRGETEINPMDMGRLDAHLNALKRGETPPLTPAPSMTTATSDGGDGADESTPDVESPSRHTVVGWLPELSSDDDTVRGRLCDCAVTSAVHMYMSKVHRDVIVMLKMIHDIMNRAGGEADERMRWMAAVKAMILAVRACAIDIEETLDATFDDVRVLLDRGDGVVAMRRVASAVSARAEVTRTRIAEHLDRLQPQQQDVDVTAWRWAVKRRLHAIMERWRKVTPDAGAQVAWVIAQLALKAVHHEFGTEPTAAHDPAAYAFLTEAKDLTAEDCRGITKYLVVISEAQSAKIGLIGAVKEFDQAFAADAQAMRIAFQHVRAVYRAADRVLTRAMALKSGVSYLSSESTAIDVVEARQAAAPALAQFDEVMKSVHARIQASIKRLLQGTPAVREEDDRVVMLRFMSRTFAVSPTPGSFQSPVKRPRV